MHLHVSIHILLSLMWDYVHTVMCEKCLVRIEESDVVLVVQVRSSVMCTPRNLVLLTLFIVELLMVSEGWSPEFLLKSITTSLVLLTLRGRFFAPHHSTSCATSSL